jgi:hypothetical protein
MQATPCDHVLRRVLVETVQQMAGVQVEPGPPPSPHPILSSWSWVKIVEPRCALVMIGMDSELAAGLANACLGNPAGVRASGEIRDVQAELTNVVSGRLAQELLGHLGMVYLGIPRTGRGAPHIQDGTWSASHFTACGRWLSVFTQGCDLHGSIVMPAPTMPDPTAANVHNQASPDQHYLPLANPNSPGSDHVPDRIGPFRIIDRLGAGGMGVVYKACHDALDRLVALKVMRADLAGNPLFVERLLREGRAAATIDHPNVVPVYDAGFADGLLYMAMRFVPGGDLATLLHRNHALPEERALVITQGCLDGLCAITEAHLIHRDIKPANILLEANGTPRLADLGLARLLVASGESRLSDPGAPPGTPAFMSPEQARSAPDIDIRSDIYSLGVTLYAMVTGKLPFTGESPYDIVAKILYHPVPDPRWIHRDLRDDTAVLIMKAMAKEPEDRFQTAQEFHGAVTAAIRNHGDPGQHVDPSHGTYWLRKLFTTPRPSG